LIPIDYSVDCLNENRAFFNRLLMQNKYIAALLRQSVS